MLIVANPVLRARLRGGRRDPRPHLAARNAGAAVLLVSEDLDELLELSDRIVVMFGGRIVYETPHGTGRHRRHRRCMAGHPEVPEATLVKAA